MLQHRDGPAVHLGAEISSPEEQDNLNSRTVMLTDDREKGR